MSDSNNGVPAFAIARGQENAYEAQPAGAWSATTQQGQPGVAGVGQTIQYSTREHEQLASNSMDESFPATVTPPGSVSGGSRALSKDPKEDQMLATSSPDEETEEGVLRNREAIEKIRDTWLYKQVKNRQDEFTNYQQATLYVGTWNVNAKGKSEDDLTPWLCADWARTGQPDIICVGFQEIVDLNAVNVAVDNKTQQKTQFWSERIHRTINQAVSKVSQNQARDGYTLVMQRSMVGLLVSLFVKNVHKARTKYVSSASVGVGVMGMLGNKGGVSVRLQFYDSTLCFVCTHLAAHRENVTGRNSDFANVYAKTSFEIGEEAIREVIRSGSLSHWAIGSSATTVTDHDIVVWLGDLNYRIDDSMATETVLKHSEAGTINALVPLDQLNIERAAGRVFQEFLEGQLTFRPTYKFQPSTDIYEQRPDKKLRAPAWCDRILWRAQVQNHVQQLTYNSSQAPNVSDHKPVYSTMRLVIKDVISEKREAIYDELMRKLDRFDNTALPIVGLDKDTLDFGEVRYGETSKLKIQIANTGNVVAQYRLVAKLDEDAICKPWMSVSPTYGMLLPGEEAATLEFSITVDNATARSLNAGREVLDDILILRLEGGRDYYITVKADYARSCFGMSLEELVMYTKPIRSIPLDPVQRAEKLDTTSGSGTALCVPKELWRIVDAIINKGLDTPGLFVEAGIANEVVQIREAIDTEAQFGSYMAHSYAEALISFLSSLSTPVLLPVHFPSVEIDSQNIQTFSRRLLDVLPPIQYNVFVYIVSLFRRALQHRQKNLLTTAKAARICCDALSPMAEQNSNQDLTKRTSMQLVMNHLLETNSI